jgi:hypothetical protein
MFTRHPCGGFAYRSFGIYCFGTWILFGISDFELGIFPPALSAPNDYRFTQSVLTFTQVCVFCLRLPVFLHQNVPTFLYLIKPFHRFQIPHIAHLAHFRQLGQLSPPPKQVSTRPAQQKSPVGHTGPYHITFLLSFSKRSSCD